MASKKQQIQTRSVAGLNIEKIDCYKEISPKKSFGDKKLENSEKLLKDVNDLKAEDEITITPTTTVTNSFFSSSIASTTATTISSRQNRYSNLISNLFGSRLYDSGIRNVTNFSFNSMELSLINKHKDGIKNKRGYRDVTIKSAKSNKAAITKSAKTNKDVSIRSSKAMLREIGIKPSKASDKINDNADRNFSSVLKGNYTTYRKKYLEGPVVGRGSFGVVKTLFSMVEILDLYQYIPTKNRPPINNLSKGIVRITDNNYEFCGIKLTTPTRAAKIMNFDKIKKTGPKNLLHILREVSIGSWNDHPNIVKVKEIYLDEQIIKYLNNISSLEDKDTLLSGNNNNVYLVMEYCSGGDLSRLYIDELDKETIIPKLFVQIFRALSYINSKGIAHRDVKPENFLITHKSNGSEEEENNNDQKPDILYDDITIKLADFGLANSSPRLLKTRAGTPYYVAPEIIKCSGNNYYNVKCDSWSAGIMLHIFLLGTCPFHDDSDVKKLNKVVNQEIDWTHEIYATIPPEAYDLLKKLLVKNPSKRISTTDSLKHLYFQKFTGYVPLQRSVSDGLIDKLVQFYKFPVLKRVALCIMIRQMSEYKLSELSNVYKYLTTFSTDLNSLNIQSLTKYTSHQSQDDNKDNNDKIDKLYYIKESLNIDQISFTEFVASQMAHELCQNNDLIANVFAGLHSDLPGRRSLFINEQDLERLTSNYTHNATKIEMNPEQMEDKRRADTQILNNIKFILNHACEYADIIYDENKLKGNSNRVGGFLRSTRGADKESSMSIDEFFLMMSFSPDKANDAEECKLSRIKRKRLK